jgi:predicted RNase H-like HicB family nuclease
MADDRAYRILVSYASESSVYRARVPELELDVEADTRAEALQKAEAAIEAKVDEVAQSGDELPFPADGAELPGGALSITLAPLTMRDLSYFAARNEMSVEELAGQLIARGVAHMVAPRQDANRRPPVRREEDQQPQNDRAGSDDQRGPRGRGRGGNRDKREGYRPDLEDKSNWLAYLREQEKGGGGGGRGRR